MKFTTQKILEKEHGLDVPSHMKTIERDGKRHVTLSAPCRIERATSTGPDTTKIHLSVSSEEPCLQLCYFENKWQMLPMRLVHSASAIDMSRVKDGMPLLDNHKGDQVALLKNISIQNSKLGGEEIVWSASERAGVLKKDYEAGVRSNVSLDGDYVDKDLEATGEQIDGLPVVRCTRWTPLGAALVTYPADTTVGFGRSTEAAQGAENTIKNKTDDIIAADKPPQVIIRKKENIMTQEEIAQRKDAFTQANEVHSIIRDFNVPEETSNKWLASLEKGEIDVPAIMREVLAKKIERRSTVAATAAKTDANIQRQLTSAPSGEAPKELADKFNIKRAILGSLPSDVLSTLGVKVDAGLERETQQEMLRVMRSVPGYENYSPRGIMVPWNMPRVSREITVQSAGVASSVVAQNLRPDLFIDVLRNKLILAQAGATVLTGLVGDVKIPRKSAAATAGWTNGEVAVANSEMTLEQLTLTPRTVGAYSDMSRQALLQSTPAIDMLVMDDLMQSTARAIQLGALHGTGATGQPTGVKTRVDSAGNTFSVGTAGTPTFAELLAANSVLGDGNVDDDGTVAWVMQPRLFNRLCSLARTYATAATTPATNIPVGSFLANRIAGGGGTVIDMAAYQTNSVTKNYAFHGRWSDLVIGHWNALELIVDPYSLSTKGALRIVGLQSVDVQIRYDAAFTYCATVGAD